MKIISRRAGVNCGTKSVDLVAEAKGWMAVTIAVLRETRAFPSPFRITAALPDLRNVR